MRYGSGSEIKQRESSSASQRSTSEMPFTRIMFILMEAKKMLSLHFYITLIDLLCRRNFLLSRKERNKRMHSVNKKMLQLFIKIKRVSQRSRKSQSWFKQISAICEMNILKRNIQNEKAQLISQFLVRVFRFLETVLRTLWIELI